ncbi:MAG: PAS domain S-box protein [Candidatus Hodarchaeales archaeon]|jgi:PAS domain S-box-containing protein
MGKSEKSPEHLTQDLNAAIQTIEQLKTFHLIVEEANDGIVILQKGMIKYVNQRIADLTGVAINELQDSPFNKYIHPSALLPINEWFRQRMDGIPVPSIYETVLSHKDGFPVEVELNAKIISYQKGPADLILVRDLAKRRKTDKKLISSLAFIESVPDSVFLFDSDLNLIDVNPAGFLGFPDEIRRKKNAGLHITEMVPGIEQTKRYQQYLSVLETGQPIIISEYAVNTRKGIQYFSSRAFKVGEGLGIITTEITDLKETKKALKQSEEQLKKVKRAEELYHSMQSHFVKNDLQRLLLSLEITLFHPSQEKEKNIRDSIAVCHHASRTIDTVNLIFSILQSVFEEKKSSISLLSLVKEVSDMITIPLKIEEASLDIQLYLDNNFKTLLYEIFSFIHSQGGGKISIVGKLDESEPRSFTIRINEKDTPPLSLEVCNRLMIGIEDENWELLGHHIGLTLVSVIAQYYGGRITIHPKKEAGNEFNIHLPFELIIPKRMF